jgi:hypothetical protein
MVSLTEIIAVASRPPNPRENTPFGLGQDADIVRLKAQYLDKVDQLWYN